MELYAIAIGDIHAPFHDPRAIKHLFKRLARLAKAGHRPKIIVQGGDAYDRYSNNRFGRSFWIDPEQEDAIARQFMEQFWSKMKEIFPRAKCYQLFGNHELRLTKQSQQRTPELNHYLTQKLVELSEFKGVTLVKDARAALVTDGIHWRHGHKSKLGDHMMETHENYVTFHTHRGGTFFHPWAGHTKFELNAGFLGNRHHHALRYTAYKKFTKWTLGDGLIWKSNNEWMPMFTSYSENLLSELYPNLSLAGLTGPLPDKLLR